MLPKPQRTAVRQSKPSRDRQSKPSRDRQSKLSRDRQSKLSRVRQSKPSRDRQGAVRESATEPSAAPSRPPNLSQLLGNAVLAIGVPEEL